MAILPSIGIDPAPLNVRRLADGDRIPAGRTARVIADMIHQFCDPDWWATRTQFGPRRTEARRRHCYCELAEIIPNIQVALDAFRAAGGLAAHVMVGEWTSDGRDLVAYTHDRDYDKVDTPGVSV